MAAKRALDDVGCEFKGASLGDARLDARLHRIAELMAAAPDNSFPDQMASVADREALYRFLSNKRVTKEKVLSGHVRQTHARMAGRSCVRIVHDTTSFEFDGEREGLGVLQRGAKGFFGHVALAIAADETREPLGVVGISPYIHAGTVAGRSLTRAEKLKLTHATPRAKKESSRWEKLACDVSAELPPGVRAIHIMDQEADDFAMMAALQEAGLAYVVRGQADRITSGHSRAKVTVRDVLSEQTAMVFRTVRLSARSKRQAGNGRHAERLERDANLSVSWSHVTIRRPQLSQTDARELSMYAVHVFESAAPDGETPIEWMLFTTEPVESLEQATEVVDHYRARWIIEEYFKALKTGCAFEKRQLMSLDALVRALALFAPLAWQLLVLRHLGRAPKVRPAAAVLDANQLLLLAAMLEKRRRKFPENPTARDAMLGIAALGGHITNNGDPGWQVLGRGFRRFIEAEVGWNLRARSDQS